MPAFPIARLLRCAAAVACGATFLLGLTGCSRSEGEKARAEVDALPVQESWGAVLHVTEKGLPALRMEAPYAARFEQEDSTMLRLSSDPRGKAAGRPALWLYNAEGEQSAFVSADQITLDELTQSLSASGAVEVDVSGPADDDNSGRVQITAEHLVRSESGEVIFSGGVRVTAAEDRRLQSERAYWEEAAGRLRVPETFTYTRPGESIRGTSLTARTDLSQITFRSASGELEVTE